MEESLLAAAKLFGFCYLHLSSSRESVTAQNYCEATESFAKGTSKIRFHAGFLHSSSQRGKKQVFPPINQMNGAMSSQKQIFQEVPRGEISSAFPPLFSIHNPPFLLSYEVLCEVTKAWSVFLESYSTTMRLDKGCAGDHGSKLAGRLFGTL